jgi:hypothetical protein
LNSALAIASLAIVVRSRADTAPPEHVPDELDSVRPLAAVPVEHDGLLDAAEPRAQADAVHLPEQRGDVGDVAAGPHEALDPAAGDGAVMSSMVSPSTQSTRRSQSKTSRSAQ